MTEDDVRRLFKQYQEKAKQSSVCKKLLDLRLETFYMLVERNPRQADELRAELHGLLDNHLDEFLGFVEVIRKIQAADLKLPQ